jgi:hypothetical protein
MKKDLFRYKEKDKRCKKLEEIQKKKTEENRWKKESRKM